MDMQTAVVPRQKGIISMKKRTRVRASNIIDNDCLDRNEAEEVGKKGWQCMMDSEEMQ